MSVAEYGNAVVVEEGVTGWDWPDLEKVAAVLTYNMELSEKQLQDKNPSFRFINPTFQCRRNSGKWSAEWRAWGVH